MNQDLLDVVMVSDIWVRGLQICLHGSALVLFVARRVVEGKEGEERLKTALGKILFDWNHKKESETKSRQMLWEALTQ